MSVVLSLAGGMLFVLMLAFPMVLALLYVKAALFAVVLALAAAEAMRRARIGLDRRVALWAFALSTVGLAFGVLGLVRDAPGALKMIQVYVGWVLVYALVISMLDERRLVWMHRLAVFTTLGVSFYGLHFLLASMGLAPDAAYLDLLSFGAEQGIGLHKGYIEVLFPGLNSLPFLIPYLLTTIVTQRRGDPEAVPRWSLWLALALAFGLVLVSGRRAILLVIALVPIFLLLLLVRMPPADRRPTLRRLGRLILVGILVVLAAAALFQEVYDFRLLSVFESFISGFEFGGGGDIGSYYRRQQFYVLLDAWADYPLFGAGHGAAASDLVRSAELPWAYELYYVALLFQTGLVGLLSYVALFMWLFWVATRVAASGDVRGRLMLPALVAFACFLVASATNPYLARFDGIWVIFWPLAIANRWLLRYGRPAGGPMTVPAAGSAEPPLAEPLS